MSVVPKPYEWDAIPDMAGTLLYERKNGLAGCCSFSFFRSIRTISEGSGMVKKKKCRSLPHFVIDNN